LKQAEIINIYLVDTPQDHQTNEEYAAWMQREARRCGFGSIGIVNAAKQKLIPADHLGEP